MKPNLLASAAAMALLAGAAATAATTAAMAADMPQSRSGPPLRAPAFVPFFTWNGFYAGIVGGYGLGTSNWSNAAGSTGSFDVDGGFVGGTLGYNVQTGGVVFGLEADAIWSAMKGSTATNCGAGCETSNPWHGTVRARIGYAFDRFLPYLTGGMAAGEVKASGAGLTGASKTQIGWTGGGGLEYAFVNKWSVKAEYLYADFGKFDCGTGCGAPGSTDIGFKAHLLRFGLNYKF
jgi:outer membrane immunogenic protein